MYIYICTYTYIYIYIYICIYIHICIVLRCSWLVDLGAEEGDVLDVAQSDEKGRYELWHDSRTWWIRCVQGYVYIMHMKMHLSMDISISKLPNWAYRSGGTARVKLAQPSDQGRFANRPGSFEPARVATSRPEYITVLRIHTYTHMYRQAYTHMYRQAYKV